MIARLRGEIVQLATTWAVIDVNGLGLRVASTPATTAGLRMGETACLHTCMVVREDAMNLYGFASPEERDCFELCRSASGVGPKLALAILSVLSPRQLAAAVRAEDLGVLCTVPGVGRKSAQKLVIELKDKVNQLAVQVPEVPPTVTGEQWREQICEGLESLGWNAKDAEAACQAIAPMAAEQPMPSVSVLMKAALASLARA
ncbi:Holliday junction branch migration protein RuvA [Propionibacterium sp.]|uniref:Holliday junction branch migration protein RuvA n=1 Tax=Propionibacterium sp. TaxID=1977903 RepID=UPI0039EBD80F